MKNMKVICRKVDNSDDLVLWRCVEINNNDGSHSDYIYTSLDQTLFFQLIDIRLQYGLILFKDTKNTQLGGCFQSRLIPISAPFFREPIYSIIGNNDEIKNIKLNMSVVPESEKEICYLSYWVDDSNEADCSVLECNVNVHKESFDALLEKIVQLKFKKAVLSVSGVSGIFSGNSPGQAHHRKILHDTNNVEVVGSTGELPVLLGRVKYFSLFFDTDLSQLQRPPDYSLAHTEVR